MERLVTQPPPTSRPRAHLPRRPLWLCRACAHPWPCGQARLDLLREFAADPSRLRIHLTERMHAALADLHALNPHQMPSPAVIFARFLAWAAPRSSRRSTSVPDFDRMTKDAILAWFDTTEDLSVLVAYLVRPSDPAADAD
jgi:hypothetical protein